MLVFSPPTWSRPPGKSPRQQCQSGALCRLLVRDGSFSRAWPTLPGGYQWRRRGSGDFSDLMCGCRFRCACSATVAGGQRGGDAVDVALRSISSPRLRSSGREVDSGGEIKMATLLRNRSRSTISPPLVCVAPGWEPPPGTLRRRLSPNGTSLYCFEWSILPPSGQFHQKNNRSGPANAAARPISPPSLASSPRDRSILE